MDEIFLVIVILSQQTCLSVHATPEPFSQNIYSADIVTYPAWNARIICSSVLYINTLIREFINKMINLYHIDDILFCKKWPKYNCSIISLISKNNSYQLFLKPW